MMINDCEPRDEDPAAGITLRCGYDFHLMGSDDLGIGPYRRQLLGYHHSRRPDRRCSERVALIRPVEH